MFSQRNEIMNNNGGATVVAAGIRFSLFVCMLLQFQHAVEGSISIISSGKTFPSKPDRKVGLQLVRGYEYMGRLQYVDANPRLCSGEHPYNQFNIVPTKDGLPVALIAQSGGCSVSEKLSIAARMINPKNQVQYLIIQDSSKRRNKNHLEGESDRNFANERQNRSLMGSGNEYGTYVHDALFGRDDGDDIDFDFNTNFDSISYENDDDGSYDVPDDINLAVLHVTYNDGQTLINLIKSEDPQVYKDGGMNILLNSKEWNIRTRTVVISMLITVTFCACFCCCVLVLVQSSFEEEDQQEAPRRPVRRRLTLEQVRRRFPAFHFNPTEHHQNYCAPKSSNTVTNDDGNTELQLDRFCQLSDECTICLDEFIAGDRVRCLPCMHVFHSTCITRWLIERSAVCPLCKLDLYEEEIIEDEGNDDGVSQLEIPSGNRQGTEDRALLTTIQNDTNLETQTSRSWWPFSLESGEPDTNIRRSSFSSRFLVGWSINLFGQRNPTTDLLTELTEPLVSNTEQRIEEENMQVGLSTPNEDAEAESSEIREVTSSPLNSTTTTTTTTTAEI